MRADFSEIGDAVLPKTVFDIYGFHVTESMLGAVFVSVSLIVAAIIIRLFVIPKFKLVPKGFQCFLEYMVDMFDGMAVDAGKIGRFLAPYTFGTAAFICFGTLVEMLGLRPPMADINTCLGLSLMSFILINFFGIQKHGPIGRIKYYFKPVVFVGPFRIMSDLMVPFSMAFRLFGSILSGMLTMDIVYAFCPILLPAALSPLFTLFHALIQSYIFAVLTITFVNEAAE